jgi:hypothetical protein
MKNKFSKLKKQIIYDEAIHILSEGSLLFIKANIELNKFLFF